MNNHVLYEEMTPGEFLERIAAFPVSYLPLGTLEWHGPHMPLGADGIQSQQFFARFAEKNGGVVLPKLFMGPDRLFDNHGEIFYGMDINTKGALRNYPAQQLPGSAYWMETEQFKQMLLAILAQQARAGVKVVVAHGHGPSTNVFASLQEEAYSRFGIKTFTCWTFAEDDHLKLQNDHAGANETSLVMAVRPDLVDFGRVESDESNLVGIAGRHPVTCSSAEYGEEIMAYTEEVLLAGLRKACPFLFGPYGADLVDTD